MLQKWICNNCGYETKTKPENRNSTCQNCKKGRFRCWNMCECGKWFHPQRISQIYCSKECGYKYKSFGGKKGKHYPNSQKARIAVCPICNKEFRAVKEYKSRKSIYCSKECWNKRATIINKCKYCGKDIKTTKSENKVYCNNECRDLDYRNTHKGKLSYFWQGGKTKESKLRKTNAQYKEWRNEVFKRDNYICQNCGRHTRDLEAHHIKAQSKYPELIYDVDNGLTLCHECHKLTDNYGYKARWETFTGKKAIKIN